MAILRNVSPVRQRYDRNLQSLGYDTGAGGGYGGTVGMQLQSPRQGVLPGNQISTYGNTTRFPAGRVQQAIDARNPMSRIQENAARFNAPAGFAASVPGNDRLSYANVNGASVLLPPRLGNPGEPIAGRLADFRQIRAEQKAANRPDADEMEARRWENQDRSAGRSLRLQEGRLARLAQQQRASRQPVTPIAAEALQNAQLRLSATREDYDRTQSGLNADTQAENLKTVGNAQTDVDVNRAQQLNPLEVEQAKNMGLAETEVQKGRLKDLAIAGADPEVLAAENARREAGLQGRLAEVSQTGQAQLDLARKQAMQDRDLAQLPPITQQNVQMPQNADAGTMSNWIEDISNRMTPEQFRQELHTNQNISPSRLRDLYEEMNKTWFPSQRQRDLKDWIGKALGLGSNSNQDARSMGVPSTPLM